MVRKFHAYACKLGADPATLLKCQLVRLPGGTRNNGNPQPVIYFNPEVATCCDLRVEVDDRLRVAVVPCSAR